MFSSDFLDIIIKFSSDWSFSAEWFHFMSSDFLNFTFS